MQKFRQSSIVFEKPGILPEKLKTLLSSDYQGVIQGIFEIGNRFWPRKNPDQILIN